jgi:hypothetical protein
MWRRSSHIVTMPIFCFDVNCADDEKPVPITRQNGASIVPDTLAIALDLVEMGPENGPFWELEAEQSQQAACEDAPSPKRDTSDVKEIKKGAPITTRENQRSAFRGVSQIGGEHILFQKHGSSDRASWRQDQDSCKNLS